MDYVKLRQFTFLSRLMLRSLTMPSSVVELDRGGDGVGDLNEEAPELDDGDGKSMKMG